MAIYRLPHGGVRPKDLHEELSHTVGPGTNGRALMHDERNGTITLFERGTTSDGLPMDRVSVFKPMTDGTLLLDFYLPGGGLPGYGSPIVRGVVASLQVDEGYAVRDLAPGESPPIPELVATVLRRNKTAALLMVLGLVGVIGGIVKKRRRG